VAGIDLGPTHTRLAVADLRGEPLARRQIETPAHLAPLELLGRIARAGKELVREVAVPQGRLLAVCAGAPGVVDRDQGTVTAAAPNLHGWTGVSMADNLQRAFGAPVVVENDVNLAILGERWRGAARGHDTCAFLSFGTGVGAGIVVDGELRRGHHSLAGEIGFMCMGPEHVETEFGSSGCLETLTGLQTLDARWRGTGNLERWVEELFEGAAAGDASAADVARDVARLVTMAVANLSLVLDPSLIVMGGALFTRGAPLLEELRRRTNRILPRPVEIALSELHEEAPLWGSLLVASASARERLRQSLWEE
jgi:predicted NBD/HSP70 family sugar kinase